MKHLGNITETIMRNGIVKRFGLAMLAVVLTAPIPISAYATGSLGRASEIKSTGNIEVKEGDETKVAIYSSDFTYLANEIDDLERTAKWKNIQALLEIGTDLGIKDENGVAAVSFKEINDAICNSQKISGTYTTEEGPEDDLVGATAENLSLGTAAWVDGEYIVGNGADNKSYYHQGYVDGFAQASESVDIEYTYHEHKNENGNVVSYQDTPIYSLDNPGGCYNSNGHTHNKTGTCTFTEQNVYCGHWNCISNVGGTVKWRCSGCGATETQYNVDTSGSGWGKGDHYKTTKVYNCGNLKNTWILGCGRKTIEEAGEKGATIESAMLLFK